MLHSWITLTMPWPFQSIPKISDSSEAPRPRPSADWNGTESLLGNYGSGFDARQFPARAAQNRRDSRPAESGARSFRYALNSITVRDRFSLLPVVDIGTSPE